MIDYDDESTYYIEAGLIFYRESSKIVVTTDTRVTLPMSIALNILDESSNANIPYVKERFLW